MMSNRRAVAGLSTNLGRNVQNGAVLGSPLACNPRIVRCLHTASHGNGREGEGELLQRTRSEMRICFATHACSSRSNTLDPTRRPLAFLKGFGSVGQSELAVPPVAQKKPVCVQERVREGSVVCARGGQSFVVCEK
jgi:hypothetical protein